MAVESKALEAITRYCLECSGSIKKERKLCSKADCPLHPYRLGKNPFREITEAQRQARSNNMRRINERKRLLRIPASKAA